MADTIDTESKMVAEEQPEPPENFTIGAITAEWVVTPEEESHAE